MGRLDNRIYEVLQGLQRGPQAAAPQAFRVEDPRVARAGRGGAAGGGVRVLTGSGGGGRMTPII